MLKPALNHSYVVDVVVLRDLQRVVVRAIARRDGSELREFVMSRRAAYGSLIDAETIRLEPKQLVTALSDIGVLERSTIAARPEARDLLAAARTTDTHSRDVCRSAFERLVPRAERLRRFMHLKAPDFLIMSEVKLVSQALGALDRFDFTMRSSADSEPPTLDDEDLVEAALACSYVADSDRSVGLGVARPFLRAPELFPRPSDIELIPGWERFCGSVPYISPPRLVWGAGIAATARRVIAFRQFVEQDLTVDGREKEEFLRDLGQYIAWLNFATRNRHAVVEWVHPRREDEWRFVMSSSAPRSWALPGAPHRGDVRVEILSGRRDSAPQARDVADASTDVVPLGFPSFLEPPPPQSRPTPSPTPPSPIEPAAGMDRLQIAFLATLLLLLALSIKVFLDNRTILQSRAEREAESRRLEKAYALRLRDGGP
jgi:hypothetical protein